jgi:hypothetical protein
MATFREVTGMTPGDYLRSMEAGGALHAWIIRNSSL